MNAETLDAVRITLDPTSQKLLPVLLALMVFSVALNLRLDHFRPIADAPVRFFAAALVQVIGLPLATLGLAIVLEPAPSIVLGMIVVASCPGGQVSNLFTHLARGDAAFSMGLTSLSSLASAIALPALIITLSQSYPPTRALLQSIDFDPLQFLGQVALILLTPLAVGMVIAAGAPLLAARLARPLTLLALFGMLGVAAAGLVKYWDLMSLFGATIGPVVVAHNALAYGLGALAGRALGLGTARRRALTFEVGQQNAGLGLVLLLSQLDGLGGAASLAALWGVWHLLAGLALVGFFRLIDARAVKSAALGASSDTPHGNKDRLEETQR